MTDSHAHIYKEYYNDIPSVLDEAKKNNITRIINNGCNQPSNEEVLELINKYNMVYGAIGFHPEDADVFNLTDLEFIEDNLNNPKVIAIGEIGLDYYYTRENKEKQKVMFLEQLKLAEKYNMPVIIHSREATLDTINTLKETNTKGIIHSFCGSFETAMEYINMGYLIGINGVITFKNANIKDVIKQLPLQSIVLETDSPYLSPHPFRGKQNTPANIKTIAEFVANLFNIKLEELENITNSNLERVFDKLV